ncbi:ABC transporter ATP-binding protein [Tropicimonas sediminicola]|uniref:Putative ABC transport system ATP-binding protein n=1 Tax=Tropicimonas sediminicola TaxID=1031541 RepID=A0A239FI23_9RHOB|nr:ABC transporter ATP-binding protein [Tropicimonas sediminicola]SNS56559.1 putative ABC transport system ATP-binding protein [Tropicimonas sediminicola]
MRIEAAGLSKSYHTTDGPQPVLEDVSLTLAPGETLALTGESGSGKSTLLHLLATLDLPDAGSIRLDGTEVTGLGDAGRAAVRRDRIGLIFQQFNLIPSLTVAGNLDFQARLAGRHDPEWSAELVHRLGLADLTDRYPEQLSGGQQQRVAIGRALAPRPSALLADEPTGNLDERTAGQVFELILELVAETRASLLVVTHSERLASGLARRLHLSRGRLA